MNATIAKNLLEQMDNARTNVTFYRGQRISRLYLRRVLWRANCYEDHRHTIINSGRVVGMEAYG